MISAGESVYFTALLIAGTLVFQKDPYYSDCAITTTPFPFISTKQPREVPFAYTEHIAGRFLISDLRRAQWLHLQRSEF